MIRSWRIGWVVAVVLSGCGVAESKLNNVSNNGTNTSNNGTNTSNNGTNNTTSGTNNTTSGTIAEPEFHRATSAACDDERAPGEDTSTTSGGDCTADSDCTDGVNGRCFIEFRSNSTYCSYDACAEDGACGACDCGAAGTNAPNICYPGNCTVDADCGDAGYCSPTQGDCGAYFGTIGYYCHTLEDECVSDADCGGTPYTTYCAYDMGVGHWICSSAQCVG